MSEFNCRGCTKSIKVTPSVKKWAENCLDCDQVLYCYNCKKTKMFKAKGWKVTKFCSPCGNQVSHCPKCKNQTPPKSWVFLDGKWVRDICEDCKKVCLI